MVNKVAGEHKITSQTDLKKGLLKDIVKTPLVDSIIIVSVR
jgi:hypothetical protein